MARLQPERERQFLSGGGIKPIAFCPEPGNSVRVREKDRLERFQRCFVLVSNHTHIDLPVFVPEAHAYCRSNMNPPRLAEADKPLHGVSEIIGRAPN